MDAAVHHALFISTIFSYLNSAAYMWLDTERPWKWTQPNINRCEDKGWGEGPH